MLEPRHIQNHSDGSDTQPHWGYPDRVVPCKNDAGSCAYLDMVYLAHDLGMLYMGIFWASLLAIFLCWALLRRASRPTVFGSLQSWRCRNATNWRKLTTTSAALTRRYLLPDANHFLFGRTTRLQVSILALLAAYLFIWSFLGITYTTWVTPVKNMPGVFNQRTALGPWADRVGVIAFALTPLSILLSSRESLLSVLTGVPYQSFNFLHRWLGYIIVIQSILHTIGWLVIEVNLYQPQPKVAIEWIVQPYIIWGFVAVFLLIVLLLLSTPWGIKLTGYEFFRKAHYVLAMVYIGACWAHWNKLECFLIPALIFWGVDRGARFIRTGLLHHHPAPSGTLTGFKPASAIISRYPDPDYGDVLRLDLENAQDPWKIGQHYFLCFTESSVWQSHPFTPINAPILERGVVKHSYIMRAKSGETKKLAELAEKKAIALGQDQAITTPVILTGGYGVNMLERIDQTTNIICIAGGTGIAYVLPILLHLAQTRIPSDRSVGLVWAMRHSDNVDWVEPEMTILYRAQKDLRLAISLFATRDIADETGKAGKDGGSRVNEAREVGSSSSEDICLCEPKVESEAGASVDKIGGGQTASSRHPDLDKIVSNFVKDTTSGPTVVFASGPGGMITDLRRIVAALNVPSQVWNRQERFDVELVCDDRLEW